MSCAAHRPCMHAERVGAMMLKMVFPLCYPCHSPADADRSKKTIHMCYPLRSHERESGIMLRWFLALASMQLSPLRLPNVTRRTRITTQPIVPWPVLVIMTWYHIIGFFYRIKKKRIIEETRNTFNLLFFFFLECSSLKLSSKVSSTSSHD